MKRLKAIILKKTKLYEEKDTEGLITELERILNKTNTSN